ncbi:MAG: hypothetical protein ACTSWR_00455 [Candidatus Helarchaeota archaeon]
MDLIQTRKEKLLNEISGTDKLIIREYIKEPQNSILQVSKNINKTRQTVAKFFKNLLRLKLIKFSVNINSQSLNLDYYLIRIELMSNLDSDYFISLLNKCPKTLFSFQSIINNQIFAIIFEEYNLNYLKPAIPCSHLINKLQNDPRVKSCTIEGLITKIFPKYLPMDERRISKNKLKAPCGDFCKNCPQFGKSCLGCPGTSLYRGNFKF